MARTFDEVLAEVTAKSDPQRKIVLDQVAALPAQQAADEAALAAKKDQAFDDILAGARRRGLGFSGIPLGEQAKYTATDYAPALANLKSTYTQRRGTLESALADIGRSDYLTAQDIFARDRAFEEDQRRFDLQQRAAASQQNSLANLFNQSQQAAKPPDPIQQEGFNEALSRINSQSRDDLVSDMISTLKGAYFGIPKDPYKIETYKRYAPELFAEAERRFRTEGVADPRLRF